MFRTKLAAAVIVMLSTAGMARADNILLPISGNWATKDGANTIVLRISNGQVVTPDGYTRGQCRIEVRAGAGFIINQGEGKFASSTGSHITA